MLPFICKKRIATYCYICTKELKEKELQSLCRAEGLQNKKTDKGHNQITCQGKNKTIWAQANANIINKVRSKTQGSFHIR